MAGRRVAVVGGGIAGSLAALGLRGCGVSPVVFDCGRHWVGGRLGGQSGPGSGAADAPAGSPPLPVDNGAQFMRATKGSRFEAVLDLLAARGLVQQWNGEHGILGKQGSDFLPRRFMPAEIVGSMAQAFDTGEKGTLRDSGDFCGFIEGEGQLYVGTPSNAAVCSGICEMVGAEVRAGTKVTTVRCSGNGEQWQLGTEAGDVDEFDAIVFASHDPSLAGSAIWQLAAAGGQGVGQDGGDGGDGGNGGGLDPQVQARLLDLADRLVRLRNEAVVPLVTLVAGYQAGALPGVPFDAATVLGSDTIQFLARDASKPGRGTPLHTPDGQEELWVAVSTSALAAAAKSQGAAEAALVAELGELFAPHCTGGVVPTPTRVATAHWDAALTDGTLEDWCRVEEDSIALESWRMAVCGDFVRTRGSPVEAAALSGLEAGERVGSWFL